jgi:hypothetical protein
MGTASSSSLKTEASKEIGGIIDVGDSKKKIIQTIDFLFQQLLTTSNPINFRQALEASSNNTCAGILVLLQSTIASEFQTLSLKNPEDKLVKTIFKGYTSADDFTSSKTSRSMCREITLFFLRLIILVGTCVLSVRPNKALTALLGTIGSRMVEESKDFQGIVKLKLKTIKSGITKPAEGAERKDDVKPDSEEILFAKLIEDPKDRDLKVTIKTILTNNDKYSVVKIKNAGEYYVVVYKGLEYVFDLYNLFVYVNEKNTSKTVGVISITGAFNDPPEKKEEPKRGGTRSRRKRQERYTRKMRGGDPTQVSIQVKEINTTKQKSLGLDKKHYYYMFNRTDPGCNNAKPVRAACASTSSTSSSNELYIFSKTPAEDFVKEVIEYYLSQFNGTAFSKEQID